MFATRINQENAVYEQQTAAASKPLNQGVKGFAPKTPANKTSKTPFKISLNDENNALGDGKTARKELLGGNAEAKAPKDVFTTPARPRNRAPLGNKTTNAKAAAFHTPGPPTQEKPSAKPTSPRVRRAKIKIHTLGVTNVNEGDNEPDIELMPAREMPLPDYPDDWPHDRAYPQFESENKTRGWFSEFAGRKHEDDDSDFSNFAEELRDVEQRKNDEPREQIKTASHKTVLNSCTTKPLQTLKSRDAALALSRPLTSTTPGFAAPTAAAKARAPSVIPTQSRLSAQGTTFGASRHTVARAASNTTVGFSKGRAVSATKRALLSRSCDDDVSEYNLVHRPGDRGRSALEDLFGTASLAIETTGSSSAGVSGLREFDDDEDEVLRNFQLETVDVTQA